METLQIGPWVIKYDADSTRKVYEHIPDGDADGCVCEFCLNFAAAREKIYPNDIRTLFDRIGIDYKKESEVFHCNKENSGLHCYSGEFCFVGIAENTEEAYELSEDRANVLTFEDDSQNFVWSFSAKATRHLSVFEDKPIATFLFAARVPWTLQAPEPE